MPTLFEWLAGRADAAPTDDEAPREPARGRGLLTDPEFVAYVSHEMRTPLDAIVGYSELLHEDAAVLRQTTFLPDLERIRRASERVVSLVDDLVDLSGVLHGVVRPAITPFAAGALVRRVAVAAAARVPEASVNVVVGDVEGVGDVASDAELVAKALTNVVRHLAGFDRDGDIRIDATRPGDEAGGWVAFSVAHAGVVLRRFEVDDLVRSGAIPTYGAGLAAVVARELCLLLGGELMVRSGPGFGTVVTAAIPDRAR